MIVREEYPPGSRKYKFHDPDGLFFISFATVGWIDVLTRPSYTDIVVESSRHFQVKKGLLLFEWTIMTNHVHLLASDTEGCSLSDILRDQKKFTSGKIHTAIREDLGECPKEWMLAMLREAGEANKHNASFQLWQQNNQPMLVSTGEVERVVDYIRMEPAVEGIVDEPDAYCYSSAHEPGILKLEEL